MAGIPRGNLTETPHAKHGPSLDYPKGEAADVGRQPELTIIVDSREQRPLALPNAIVRGLPTGDYSVLGYEDRIAVERKSLEDIYGCFGQSRERFERELERLALIEYRAIVVEATLADVLAGTKYSQVHPHSAVGSLISWSVRYHLPVWLCGDRRSAAATVRKILHAAVKEIETAAGALAQRK